MSRGVVFEAPWDRKLILLTSVNGFIVVVATVSLLWVALTRPPTPAVRVVMLLTASVSATVFLLGAALAPRGYVVEEGRLVIRRWVASIGIPLAEVRSVEPLPPESLAGSVRVLGSDGLFGYYGRFRNQELGRYRLYATRSRGYVLVRAGLPYVLTPDPAERFIEAVRAGRAREEGAR